MRITLNQIAFWVSAVFVFSAVISNPYYIGKWFYEFNKGVQGVGQINKGE
jgi:hypothetical protein